MKYVYYVSYIYCEGGKTMYASTEISDTKEITSIIDVKEAADIIAKKTGLKHTPTIMFYQLLRKESKEDGNTEKDS